MRYKKNSTTISTSSKARSMWRDTEIALTKKSSISHSSIPHRIMD